MTGRRVLLTGTSGLALTHVLQQLKACVRPAPRCAKAERHFLECVEETGLVAGLTLQPPELAMIQALDLPRDVLLDCWGNAFRRLADADFPDFMSGNTPQEPPISPHIVLASHMCFYHQQTREFVSLIDLDMFKDRFPPDIVVTLVDDVEHVFERLRRPHHMLSHYDYNGFRGFALLCKHLTQLMHWRSSEIAFAEVFARLLGCRHYVLAVKHPTETLASLLFDRQRPRAYLSHPISEPRRRLAAGDSVAFDTFCRELEAVATALRGRLTLFEPTAIDEFRFRNFQVPNPARGEPATVYLPKLAMRWPIPNNGKGLLWSPVQDEAPVALSGSFSDEQLTAYEAAKNPSQSRSRLWRPAVSWLKAATKSHRELENSTHLVGALVGQIGRSVTARDLKLVEQSDHLIVVRPLFNGNPSGGVREEIRQHCRLMVSRDRVRNRGRIWVLTCESDEDAWRRIQVARWLYQLHKFSQVEAEALVSCVDTSSSPLGTDRDGLMAGLRELVSRKLLEALIKEVQRAGKQPLVRPSDDAGDQPLKAAPEVQAASTRRELTDSLLDYLTPPYLEWPIRLSKRLDKVVPVTIYWGEEWPGAQVLAELCRRATEVEQAGVGR